MTAPAEICVLGAAGRTGSGVARRLAERGLTLVLVGRDPARLTDVSRSLRREAEVLVAGTLDATVAALRKRAPAVVVNTIGPFAQTAPPIVRACSKGTHYVDLSNELLGVIDLLTRHDEMTASGTCVVTGAGYGFVGTESVVRRLCEGRPAPSRVRVDAIPYISEGGVPLGEALAASIVDSLAAGGRAYRDGRLVRTRPGANAETLTAPDGSRVTTAGAPTGDLEAARRASGAPSVVAASSELPSGATAQLLMPVLSALVRWRPLRDVAVRRLAAMRAPAPRKGRTASWGHARAEWRDGTAREGWLRTGDGMNFTVAVLAEVAARLAGGGGRPGAYTPGDLFGPELAEAAGAEISLGDTVHGLNRASR